MRGTIFVSTNIASIMAVALLVAGGCGDDGAIESSSMGGTGAADGAAGTSGNGGAPGGQDSTAGAGSVGVAGNGATAGTASSAGAGGAGEASSTAGSGGDGSGAGGASGDGGSGGTAGAAGSGTPTGVTGPCDIYQSAGTPCVAAHSTVRALFGAYGGSLYQVRRASDQSTKDIPVLSPGSYADASVQDAFCAGTTCTISIIYDQSPNQNHLEKAPPGGWLNNGGLEADAGAARVMVGGHALYGVYTTSNFDNDVGAVGYRQNATTGVPTGDEPESMYMVVSGEHYNQWCCFDYGNAETNNLDNGKATMEAVYFGNSEQWGKGSGSGPWVMADLEDGVYAGESTAPAPTNGSIVATYVTAMLKGHSGNRYALKAADAQSGSLETKYDGSRPAGYSPQKKEGAIILGIGGDNSHTGEGTFFEGCMTAGVPSDATDDAVQANIVGAGYGR